MTPPPRKRIAPSDLDGLQRRALERVDLPGCFADVEVPSHLLLELLAGYAPASDQPPATTWEPLDLQPEGLGG